MPLHHEIIDRTFRSPQGENAYRICETLLDAGFDAWWVGGGVRDMLLGEIPDDIDIATNALPEEIVKLFPKCDETSKDLGAILIAKEGHVFEVTTFRKEHAVSDGRFPSSVEFCSKDEDAARRDFTINAMYFHPISSELWDPYNGEQDVKERLIRFIGNPTERIQHDALRLLRAIRFRAALNGQYHPDTFAAIHAEAKSIDVLSGTRRLQEIEKMLLGPHPEIAFEDMWETDVIEHLIPELHACKGVAQPSSAHQEGDVWNHTMQVISSFTEDHGIDTRLAALMHDVGKPATFSIDAERIKFNEHAPRGADIAKNILDRLQCTRSRREKICWIIEHHMMMGTFTGLEKSRKAHWYYHPWFIELLQVFWLDIAGTTPSNFDLYESIIKDYNAFLDSNPRPKKPLLSGDEIMEILGIQEGEKVGEIMKSLHTAQVNDEISSKAEAADFIARHH